jgi:hypothetical protein
MAKLGPVKLDLEVRTVFIHPRHFAVKRLLAKAIGTFEHDPDFQIAFHKTAMLFWIAAAVLGTFWCVGFPGSWQSGGVLAVFLISIYSNWDTDYDAVSAASAFKHAQAADTKIETDK